MHEAGVAGSIVTLACDPGERYLDTYYSRCWLSQQGYDIEPPLRRLREFHRDGTWS